jgi:hypothetical protein
VRVPRWEHDRQIVAPHIISGSVARGEEDSRVPRGGPCGLGVVSGARRPPAEGIQQTRPVVVSVSTGSRHDTKDRSQARYV